MATTPSPGTLHIARTYLTYYNTPRSVELGRQHRLTWARLNPSSKLSKQRLLRPVRSCLLRPRDHGAHLLSIARLVAQRAMRPGFRANDRVISSSKDTRHEAKKVRLDLQTPAQQVATSSHQTLSGSRRRPPKRSRTQVDVDEHQPTPSKRPKLSAGDSGDGDSAQSAVNTRGWC